jgi:hypothetical protein
VSEVKDGRLGEDASVSTCRHGLESTWCSLCREAKGKASAKRKAAPPKTKQGGPQARIARTTGASSKKSVSKSPARSRKPSDSAVAPRRLQPERIRAAIRQHEAELRNARRRGDKAAAAAARERLTRAQRRLQDAQMTRPSQTSSVSKGRGDSRAGSAAHGQRSADAVIELGVATRPPALDPDLEAHRVWVLRTGTAYHRADCHVLDNRSGAGSITSKEARRRGLKRCDHCSPLA